MATTLHSARVPAMRESSGIEWLCECVLTITMSGVIDELADPVIADRARHHLRSPTLDTLVLDASRVQHLSTRGAVTLLECAQRARLHAVTLYLVSSAATTSTLHQLGVLERFTTIPTARHARVVTHD